MDMEGANEVPAILEALANNEKLVSQLYDTVAKTFPEHKDFWSGLAGDEKNHASWIRDFRSLAQAGTVSFDQKRFNLKAIKTFSDYISQVISQAEGKEMTLRSALGSAWDIENALIEKDFLKVFETDSPELKQLLQQLYTATSEHRNKVKNALDSLKGA